MLESAEARWAVGWFLMGIGPPIIVAASITPYLVASELTGFVGGFAIAMAILVIGIVGLTTIELRLIGKSAEHQELREV